jgi:hypothetical protein
LILLARSRRFKFRIGLLYISRLFRGALSHLDFICRNEHIIGTVQGVARNPCGPEHLGATLPGEKFYIRRGPPRKPEESKQPVRPPVNRRAFDPRRLTKE